MTKTLRKISLSKRILSGFIILTFFPILILGVSIYLKSIQLFEVQAQTYSLEIIEYVAEQCLNILRELKTKTANVLYSQSVQEATLKVVIPPESEYYDMNEYLRISVLETILEKQILFQRLDIINFGLYLLNDENQEILINSGVLHNLAIIKKADKYIGRFRGVPDLSLTADGNISLTREMILTKQVLSIGIFACVFDVSIFDPLNKLIAQSGYVSILDQSAKVVYSTLPGSPRILKKGKLQNQNIILDGVRYRNYQKFLDDVDWLIIYSIPYTAINRSATELSMILIITALCLLVVSTIFSIMLSNSINTPLKEISSMIGMIKNGHYEYFIIPSGNDELTEIEITINEMASEINRLFNQVYNAEARNKEAQLAALQSQINPHFLFNTLDSIRWQARHNGDLEVAKRIELLAKIFHKVLSDPNEITTIKEELDHTYNYLYFQKLRFKDRLNYQFDVEEHAETAKIIHLILQPLVENSIVHGMEPSDRSISITVEIGIINNMLGIIVRDDGIGEDQSVMDDIIKNQNNSSEHGIGLHNVASRITLMYGSRGHLSVKTAKGSGTTIIIEIPFSPSEL